MIRLVESSEQNEFLTHVSSHFYVFFFFFNDTATTEISTLSLHDALPISAPSRPPRRSGPRLRRSAGAPAPPGSRHARGPRRRRTRAPRRGEVSAGPCCNPHRASEPAGGRAHAPGRR